MTTALQLVAQPALHITSTPSVNAAEGERYTYSLSADNAPFTVRLVEAPKGMEVVGKQLTWVPAYDQSGQHTIIVEVVDDGNKTARQDFDVYVEKINRLPVFISKAVTAGEEGRLYRYEVEVRDDDNDDVQLSLRSGPPGMVLNDDILQWLPGYQDSGNYTVVLNVVDHAASVTQAFEVSIADANRRPVINSEPSMDAYEGIDYRYAVTADDVDGDALDISLHQGPSSMRVKGNTVYWTPGYADQGSHRVVVAVSDGVDRVLQSYELPVVNINREPDLADIQHQSVIVGKRFRYQLSAADVDGDDITYRLIYAPDGMTLSSRGKLHWRPSNQHAGEHTVIVAASDGDLKTRKHFILEVLVD